MKKIEISVVIPVYGCCESLYLLYDRLKNTLDSITENFEIIMVNDASPDKSWNVIKELSEEDSRVKGIKLSRNFGQHPAIKAGLTHTKGDKVVIMDCDLQDQPEEILKLNKKMLEGYDIVVAKRTKRKDGFLKKLSSKLFYLAFNYLSGQKHDSSVANFGIFKRKIVNLYLEKSGQNKFFPFFVNSVGFEKTEIEIEHNYRDEGKTSYNLFKLINLSISVITAFSNKPLMLFMKFGCFLSVISFFMMIYIFSMYLIYGIDVSGWASTIITIIFFNGVILMNLGVVGLYIGNVYSETKNERTFYIEEVTNLDTED
ncbi:glycosyltransferase family 2 protein [Vibrio pectenicida]|uniref:Glycosyltransferase family 2 protein n=1 Tax=Vibrio pectenicida TaxID=62763 RepID=A0A7Y4EDT1_9VIBR|nr:glycosyltransferase family 2 protein [Vibrio pectenicida]NOH70732.1 glycosyltransferase family 2 protein [Vibrio pectenicida]